MTTNPPTGGGKLDPIKTLCWLGIGLYLGYKALALFRGATLGALFDFANPSLAGLAAGACALGLILRSPRIRQSATMIEANETRAVTLSFVFVFILMAAYYTLRPVRDSMASNWSDSEIAVLWNIQFFLSTAVVAVYGVACSRIKFRLLVPAVYIFYAVTFAGFYFGAALVSDRELLDKCFYVWVSLFSLFHLSVFWSFMADLFNKEQSKRLFAFIAAGASAGAAAGPLVAAVMVRDVGNDNLMLFAAVMLAAATPLIFYLQRLKVTDLRNETVQSDLAAARLGGKWWIGFKDFVTNPFLLTIGAFILLYTAISSFVYFEQTNLLRPYADEERTAILASLAAVVNILTFGLGLFVTGRLVTRLGMPSTLALMPFIICAGLLILAFAPILTVLLVLQVTRQAGNYGVTRPAREMLFTSVDRETRFKAKPVVDVALYRGGDAVWGTAFAALTDVMGFGMAAMAGIGAGIAAVWAAAGIYLGRVFNRRDVPAQEAPAQVQRAEVTA
ncbi:MAG TPA: MFS transporter [Gammaproteobacteria bacterium]